VSFFDDVLDVVTSVVDTVTAPVGAALDVVTSVPGFREASEAVKDFARTPAGMIVFRALATTLGGPLAAVVGPQVASVAWSVPGLARGEDFWTAYAKEFQWRLEQTASYFGGGELGKAAAQKVGEYVGPIAKDLTERLGAEGMALLSRSLSDVADEYGSEATELAVYLAMKAVYEAKGLAKDFTARFGRVDFDPATGELIATTGTERRHYLGRTSFQADRFDTSAMSGGILARLGREQDEVVRGAAAAEAEARKRESDMVLAVVIVGAVAALAYWKRKELRP